MISQKRDEVIAAANHPSGTGSSYFMSILDTEDDPICKWHAIKAIGHLRASEAREQLLGVLKLPDINFDKSSLHRICAWAIGYIGSSFTDDIIGILESTSSDETRIATIDTLGEIGDPRAIPVLEKQLQSKQRSIRLWAALSLGKIGEASIPSLKQALKCADPELVFIIVDALVIIGTKQTIPVLARAFQLDPDAVTSYFARGPSERIIKYSRVIQRSSIEIPERLLACVTAVTPKKFF